MLIFLDIETTGFESDDKICSLGLLCFEEDEFLKSDYALVNEAKKIPAKASALHNITNEMIAKAKPLRESSVYKTLSELNKETNTLVVHDASFVLAFLDAADLRWNGTIIDTKKLVKHTIQECEIFTLEFLRYELKLYRQEERYRALCGIKDALIVHHALHDALLIKMLYDYLHQEIDLDTMARLSFENVLLEKFPFGKYQGRYIEEIVQEDFAYLEWLLALEDLDSDLRYSLTYYLEG
ncbi:MAG: exonuclease domain-containing protein [Sulfurimonas sp.]